MTASTVDILMATYNGERFIREQIESIQSQSYKDWRLLVSDDGSNDGTLNIIRKKALLDSRIHIVADGIHHGSAQANFMHLLSLSTSPYAMFSDQDDVWLPKKVEKSLARLDEMESKFGTTMPLLAFCDMKVVGTSLDVINESFEGLSNFDPLRIRFNHLLVQNVAAGCCMIMNQATAKICCRVYSLEHIEMHDWWAMLVASAFGKIEYIDEPLSLYRQHGQNVVGAKVYSPLMSAKNKTMMREYYLSSVRQAKAFRDSYYMELSNVNLRSIDEYIAASKARYFIQGITHLFRSGCWKRGARKLGQLVVIGDHAIRNRRGEK